MPNNLEKIKEQAKENFQGHIACADVEFSVSEEESIKMLDDLIEESYHQGRQDMKNEFCDFLWENGHGGGNFRQLILQFKETKE